LTAAEGEEGEWALAPVELATLVQVELEPTPVQLDHLEREHSLAAHDRCAEQEQMGSSH
jgi:hypothetical protein